jgi:hypothetical protein
MMIMMMMTITVTFDTTNEDILKELNKEIILDKFSKHKNNWIQYVDRMQRNGDPKLFNNYKELGKASEETTGRMGQEWANKWPNSLTA